MATPNSIVDGEIKEGLGEIQDFYTIDTPDDKLVKMIDRKINKATIEYEKLKTEGKINERYWHRNQLEGIDLRWHNSRIVQNRIYMGVETMVPIITSKPAEPVISIVGEKDKKSKENKKFIDTLQSLLLDKYYDEDHPQQEIYEMISRHLLLYKIGIPKIRWDNEIDDYIVEFVHPHKIIISPDGHYNEDVWVAQYMEETLDWLLKEFPEKENDIMANLFPGSTPNKDDVGSTPVGFWEYWPEDGKYVVWKMRDVILQKKLNPYFFWKNDKTFDREKNHFAYPRKPFMFLNSQNIGRRIWDETTPVSQGLSLQDGINLMQRIITDTARDQGILVGAQELIDRDELYKYTGAPNEKLSVKGNDPTKALHRVPPKQSQPFVQDNLLHLENAIDNVMGMHSSTRGEQSRSPTLGQDLMSKESDYGRIDAIVRGVERVAAELYNWELQMIAVKYKKKHFARVIGEDNADKVYKALQEAVKKVVKISVKSGSTLPTDKISQRAEAIELVKANKISDIDFFERMDWPNPEEAAERLYLQNNAPEKLYPKLVEELETDKKKVAEKEGRLNPDGSIQPTAAEIAEIEAASGQTQTQGVTPPVAPVAPVAPTMPTQPQVGTEHTQRLLNGEPVPPFEGIDPSMYEQHVSQELQFMGTDEFMQLPEEIQANYAKHVLAERQMIQGEVNAPSIGATA